jgi:hypothetical protein
VSSGSKWPRLEAHVATIDSSEIPREDRPELAAHVAGLRLEPASIALRVGDTVLIRDRIRVLVIDSAGASLGRLPIYDSRLGPGAVAMIGFGQLTALRPGTSEFEIRFPRLFWRGRDDPPPMARLRIDVHE